MTFVQEVKEAIADVHLLKHPFYQAWNDGELTRDQIKYYAEQYTGHIHAFPRGVSAVHSLCDDAEGRALLMENLIEEEGMAADGHVPHPVLWTDFGTGMGATRDEMDKAELTDYAKKLRETFYQLCRKSYASGLAALYAYEYQNVEVSETKIDGLVKHYGVSETDAKTLAFFKVHGLADVEHTEACEALLERLPEDQKAEAKAAAREHAEALWDFLSAIQHKLGIRCEAAA